MALQNYVDYVGPKIMAAWLNAVDVLKETVFGNAATKAQARTALTSDAPLEVYNGGTGSRTGALASMEQTPTELAAGITPTNYGYVPGDVRRYGAVGDGATDDSNAFSDAATTGHRLLGGGSEYEYLIDSDVEMSDDFVFDGQGCTILLSGTSRFHKASPASVTTTVSSGATQGSVSLVVASATSIVAGLYARITATGFPSHWFKVVAVGGTTISIDHAVPFDYTGTITFRLYESGVLRERCHFSNIVFDGSMTTGPSADSGNVVRAVGYKDTTIRGCAFVGYNITTGFAVLVQIYIGLDSLVTECRFSGNVIHNASDVVDFQEMQSIRFTDNLLEGSHFGVNLTRSGNSIASDNVLIGRATSEPHPGTYSVRGIKFTSCATAVAMGNQISEYETGIRVDNGFRFIIMANSLRNMNWFDTTNTTGLALAVSASDSATMFGGSISCNMIENCGGNGIGLSYGNLPKKGRCIIDSNYIRRVNGYGIYSNCQDVIISNNYMEDWCLCAGAFEGIKYYQGVTAIGNRFSHSSSATPECFNVPSAIGYTYVIENNVSQDSNPLGVTLENSGATAVASGNTSITVTHGLSVQPSEAELLISPTNNPTTDPVYVWIDIIGSTTFNINCKVNPGATGASFQWRARIQQPFTL